MSSPEYFLDYQVDLTVDSNDPDEPTAKSSYGHGASGPTLEEGFVQIQPYVDVLWVVDNSCRWSPLLRR